MPARIFRHLWSHAPKPCPTGTVFKKNKEEHTPPHIANHKTYPSAPAPLPPSLQKRYTGRKAVLHPERGVAVGRKQHPARSDTGRRELRQHKVRADSGLNSPDIFSTASPKKEDGMVQKRVRQIIRLFTHDIWLADIGTMDRKGRILFQAFRLLYIVGNGFLRDRCLLRAAALSYTTVLSIAPFLAVAFSISKALGVQNTEYIRELLLRASAGREAMVDQILAYVDNTNVKTLGTMGLVILLFSVISMMGTIEKAFNAIWDVKKGRDMWRKFTDFFSVTLICPVFVLLGISLTVSLENEAMVQQLLSITAFNYLHFGLIKLTPYFMIGLALTVLYIFLPNTKVRFVPAVIGGMLAGVMWQTAQWAYITYQIGANNYNAIYGSFAQFPLFLLWLYISWSIVLLGAEIGYAVQHAQSFTGEIRAGHISRGERDHIGVLIMLLMTRDFERGKRPEGAARIASRLKVPVKTVTELLADLQTCGLVFRLEGDDQACALAKDPGRVRILDIISALAGIPPSSGNFVRQEYRFVEDNLSRLMQAAAQSPENLTLRAFHQQVCDTGQAACLH